MRRAVATGTAALVISVALSACGAGGGGGRDQAGRAGAGGGGGPVRVVAGFYPLYEAAQRVGGDRVEVTNLTPAGAEPHDLELTPRQVDRIEDADVVLYFGGGFQPAIEEVAERSEGTAVDLLEGLTLVHGEEGPDPHVWLDLELMRGLVERVRAVLVAAEPGGEADFTAGADAYRAELEALDSKFQSALAGCQRTTIVTAHAAFGYLARRYGLTQEAIAGFSPEAEPDPKRLAALIDLVRRTGTTTIYYETLVSPRIAETLAREAGVGTAVLNPIEGLTQDEARAGATYSSVMDENLAALVQGLGCG